MQWQKVLECMWASLVIGFISRDVSCSKKCIWILVPQFLKTIVLLKTFLAEVLFLRVTNDCVEVLGTVSLPLLTLGGLRVWFVSFLSLERRNRIPLTLRETQFAVENTHSGVHISHHATCCVALGWSCILVRVSFPTCKGRLYVQSYPVISILCFGSCHCCSYFCFCCYCYSQAKSFPNPLWEGL